MLKNIKLTNMKTSERIFPRLVYKGRKDIVFTYIFFFHLFKLMLSQLQIGTCQEPLPATEQQQGHLPSASSGLKPVLLQSACDCTEAAPSPKSYYGPSPTAFLEQALRVIWFYLPQLQSSFCPK